MARSSTKVQPALLSAYRIAVVFSIAALPAHLSTSPIYGTANFVLDAVHSLPHLLAALYLSTAVLCWHVRTAVRPALATVILTVCVASFARFAAQLAPFYLPQARAAATSGDALRLYYGNIMVGSADAHLVAEQIDSREPDIVGFVELTPEFLERWTGRKNFPFELSFPKTGAAGLGLFSKFPLEKRSVISPGEYFWGVGVTVHHPTLGELPLFLIHPPPPHYDPTLSGRATFVAKLLEQVGEPRTIVLGDLNMSPFSSEYHELVTVGKLSSSMAGHGFQITWRLLSFPILRTAIDAVLHGKSWETEQFDVLSDVGSDHRPLFTELRGLRMP